MCQPRLPISTSKPELLIPQPPLSRAKVSLSDDCLSLQYGWHKSSTLATNLLLKKGKNRKSTYPSLSIPVLSCLSLPGFHTAEIQFHLHHIPCSFITSSLPFLPPPPAYFPLLYLHVYNSPLSNPYSCHHTHTHRSDSLPLSPLHPVFQLTRSFQRYINRKTTANKNQRKMLPVQSANVSLHFFSTPLAAWALCRSFSQCTAAPPSTSLISCPSLFLSVSSRCSMYVSVCEPAEPPECLHVRLSVVPDLAHLERTEAFLKCPSDKGFLSLHISLFPIWIQPFLNPASLSPCFRRHFEFPWQHGAAWIRILCMTVLVSTSSLWWPLSTEALDQIYYGAVVGPGDRQRAN